MNKYSEIEIETAKNLLEKGYKWIARSESGRLFAHCDKPIKVKNIWGSFGDSVCVGKFVPIFQSIHFGDKEPVSLESIVHPQILDDVEKRYLKGVIRPFRDKVVFIMKRSSYDTEKEYISIRYATSDETYLLPFKKGTMYRGMIADKNYTLEELWL